MGAGDGGEAVVGEWPLDLEHHPPECGLDPGCKAGEEGRAIMVGFCGHPDQSDQWHRREESG